MLRKFVLAGAIALVLGIAALTLILPVLAFWSFLGCYFTFGMLC